MWEVKQDLQDRHGMLWLIIGRISHRDAGFMTLRGSRLLDLLGGKRAMDLMDV